MSFPMALAADSWALAVAQAELLTTVAAWEAEAKLKISKLQARSQPGCCKQIPCLQVANRDTRAAGGAPDNERAAQEGWLTSRRADLLGALVRMVGSKELTLDGHLSLLLLRASNRMSTTRFCSAAQRCGARGADGSPGRLHRHSCMARVARCVSNMHTTRHALAGSG